MISQKIFHLLGDLVLGRNSLSKGLQTSLLFLHRHLRQNQHQRVQSRLQSCGFSTFTSVQYFDHLIQNAKQSWYILRHPNEIYNHLEIENTNAWNTLIAQEKPQVFWGIHSGPFEWMHQLLTSSPKTIHLITLESPNSMLSNLRARENLKVWHHTQLGLATRACLKDKGILAILLDQGPTSSAQRVTILNQKLPLFIHHLPRFHQLGFEINFFQIHTIESTWKLSFETQTKSQVNSHKLIEDAQKKVEQSITESPLDFVWHYKKHQF